MALIHLLATVRNAPHGVMVSDTQHPASEFFALANFGLLRQTRASATAHDNGTVWFTARPKREAIDRLIQGFEDMRDSGIDSGTFDALFSWGGASLNGSRPTAPQQRQQRPAPSRPTPARPQADPALSFSADERKVLSYLLRSPNSVTMERIADNVDIVGGALQAIVNGLRDRGFIKRWSQSGRAMYYTMPNQREAVRNALGV